MKSSPTTGWRTFATANRAEQEGKGWLVVRAARSAGPYLLRRRRWHNLDTACERLLARDPSAAAAGLVLPMLTTAIEANTDPALALNLGRTYTYALERIDSDQAVNRYRELLDTALAREDFGAPAASPAICATSTKTRAGSTRRSPWPTK